MLPVAVEPLSIALPPCLSTIQIINYFDATQAERNALTLAGALASLPPAPSLPNPMPAAPLSYLTDLVAMVSGQEPLDHEQQRELLVHLERALRSADPQERRGGLDVLEQLSGRDNLYADVDRRLTWLKANTQVPSSSQSAAQPVGRSPGSGPPAAPPVRRATPGGSATSPKPRKLKWALVAALAVVAVVCIVGYVVWPKPDSVNTQTAQPVSPAGTPGQPTSRMASPGQSTSAAGQTAQPGSSAGQTVLPFSDLLSTIGVAVDSASNVYVTDGNRVLKLATG